jgi:hypothetical protein
MWSEVCEYCEDPSIALRCFGAHPGTMALFHTELPVRDSSATENTTNAENEMLPQQSGHWEIHYFNGCNVPPNSTTEFVGEFTGVRAVSKNWVSAHLFNSYSFADLGFLAFLAGSLRLGASPRTEEQSCD